jgi:hypothetical protein
VCLKNEVEDVTKVAVIGLGHMGTDVDLPASRQTAPHRTTAVGTAFRARLFARALTEPDPPTRLTGCNSTALRPARKDQANLNQTAAEIRR